MINKFRSLIVELYSYIINFFHGVKIIDMIENVPTLIYTVKLSADDAVGQILDKSQFKEKGIIYIQEYISYKDLLNLIAEESGPAIIDNPELLQEFIDKKINQLFTIKNITLIKIKYRNTKEERWEFINEDDSTEC